MKQLIAGLMFAALLIPAGCKQHPENVSKLLFYSDSDEQKRVRSAEDWEKKRREILHGMEEAMGKLPSMSNLPPFNVQIRDSLKEALYTRYTIHFTAAENEIVPALLYIPSRKARNGKLPAMLALHGTGDAGKLLVDGLSPLANRAYGKELAERGYIVIAPDYPSMGELKDYDFKNDRYESGTMKAIFNHMRCVDFLQSRADVDPQRLGVIGHSLGGHNAMFLGAFDTRLKVIVASCGWTLMDFYDIGEEASKRYGGRLGPWAQDRYMPLLREKFQLDSEKIPFDFDQVIAAIAPRAFFSNSPLNDSNFEVAGVRQGVASASDVYRFFNAGENLQVHYPEAAHDFPPEVRVKAYQFIDKVLDHTPNEQAIK